METLTLSVAVIGSFLVLFLKPAKAFAAFIITLLVYPTFLVVSIGTIDITSARIVISVLFLRCLMNPRLRRNFHLSRIDKWVLFSISLSMLIPFISYHQPVLTILENRSGALMDSLFVYLVARFCITSYHDLVTCIKWVSIVLIPLSLLGVVESVTGWQPFLPLMRYCPWYAEVIKMDVRFGFYRAIGPFGHATMFGAAFVLFLPLIYSLRYDLDWKKSVYILCGFAVAGAWSSMSSSPLMMVIIVIGCLMMEKFKHLIKPIVVSVICSIIAVSIISNRPFYHVIASYANPFGGTGWHRAKLIDLAIEHFGEWCLVGYGGRDPGWGPSLGMTWTDVTNQYILSGVNLGLLGVIVFCGVLTVSLLSLISSYRLAKDPKIKSLYWAMGSIIVMLIISFNSCTFFTQTGTLYTCILGMISSASSFIVRAPVHLVKSSGGMST